MVCETFSKGDSFIHRLDGRLRLVAAVALSVTVALLARPDALAAALAAAVALAVAARLPVQATVRRMLSLNAFLLVLVAMLPVTMGQTPLLHLGPIAYTREGLRHALVIAAKANAIVLVLTALLSTVEPVALGRAMSRLHVPGKLIHLYFFTVRYLDVLHHEFDRLRRAMAVRCFRPRMNLHTYRSVGYLVGMLLVKSFDRSERIVAAMKCRGFQGRFYVAGPLALTALDAAFAAAAAAAVGLLGYLQWR
jgi:cobalt/nickel transport system permease protein